MKTAVLTDSNSGISKEEAREAGVFVLPMPVIIDEKTYYEGVDLTSDYFFERLTGGGEVSTSQPSPADMMDTWAQILAQGYDEVLFIPMSSGLSNSCSSAMGLAADYKGKVTVVDNHRISVTLRDSVLEAKFMADTGMDAAAIKEYLEKTAYDSTIYIAVDTLEFLKKGGRVTPGAAALGAVLNIKPILTIQGERLDSFAKVRGMKKCRSKILQALEKDRKERFKDVDIDHLNVSVACAGVTDEEAEDWRKAVADTFLDIKVVHNPLSLSISCHTGPRALGVGMSVIKK